jgi:uncharacterized protein YjbI with pentapeptide repeats
MSKQYVTVGGEKVRLASLRYLEPDAAYTATLFEILAEGSAAWNYWRDRNPRAYVDLRGISLLGERVSLDGINLSSANLHGANLGGVSLNGADLRAANLSHANLQSADLHGAKMQGADLSEADLNVANLTAADLRAADLSRAGLLMADASKADLRRANLEAAYIWEATFVGAKMAGANFTDALLRGSDFSCADLSAACLEGASLVETDFSDANLNGCRVYGASVWKSALEGAEQHNLIITSADEPVVTVDNLKVAQFIYLLRESDEFRDVIDTMTSKVVLILGRFTARRKRVLEGIKAVLSRRGFLPVVFDFQAPASRDLQETVSTLAHLARFIIADISDPRSIPQELASIVPQLPSVPVKPIICHGERPWGMYKSIARYPWVLELFEYRDFSDVTTAVETAIVKPAEDYLERVRNPGLA